jgi:formylglycine-generating enzyme required for sulfatase activity
VTTASYYRSYDGVSGTSCYGADCNSKSYPAQVSDFRLDKYEITVGRFRKYVAAVEAGWTPGAGSGKHTHLNGGQGLSNGIGGYETGWDTSWNTSTNFPTASATWDTNLNCSPYETWAAGNDNRPINCIDWYDAAAFCIWDGGFLPSEAEWNYAASGGIEQRVYPWGSTAPVANTNLAIYGCYYNGTGSCTGVTNIANVGIVPAGNGKYGQSDLAGNVWEWNLDVWNTSYSIATCTNCSYLVSDSYRVIRGGAFYYSAPNLLAGYRSSRTPTTRFDGLGARCARTP